MVLAAYGYVEERGSGSQSTSRPWPVTSSEWSGHGWTRCWSHRLPWRPLPPLHEATRAVASPLMPTRTGYGAPQRPHRPQHKPRPEQPNPSRLTALTPQNQPEKTLVTRESRITVKTPTGVVGALSPTRYGARPPASWVPHECRVSVERILAPSYEITMNSTDPGKKLPIDQ